MHTVAANPPVAVRPFAALQMSERGTPRQARLNLLLGESVLVDDYAEVERLLALGADPTCDLVISKAGATRTRPLFAHVIEYGGNRMIELLRTGGRPIDAAAFKGKVSSPTPLMAACLTRNAALVRDLIESGHDIEATVANVNDARTNGWGVGHFAAAGGGLEVIAHLGERGVFAADHGHDRVTQVDVAAMYCKADAVGALAGFGVSPRVRINDGLEAIHRVGVASDSEYEESEAKRTIEALTVLGVDVDVKSDDGSTGLHRAVADGDDILVQAFLECGANANVLDRGGANAIAVLAASKKQSRASEAFEALARMLLEAGSSPMQRRRDRQTAFDLLQADQPRCGMLRAMHAQVDLRDALRGAASAPRVSP